MRKIISGSVAVDGIVESEVEPIVSFRRISDQLEIIGAFQMLKFHEILRSTATTSVAPGPPPPMAVPPVTVVTTRAPSPATSVSFGGPVMQAKKKSFFF